MGQCVSRRSGGEKGWGEETKTETETEAESVGCLAMAKEKRSRLYILRRCVVMLLCWNKYGKLCTCTTKFISVNKPVAYDRFTKKEVMITPYNGLDANLDSELTQT
ncbi:hypothetical protein ACMD2_03631 [Ananas comosus]|uniref:Uncharacterized protein n=1 Tax=Ananas comosus TaxID=4615 RepID=A0A199W5I9_ANACO|nr:hypothetical protein ACMD2_03631 [Ananas comosus]